MGDNYKNISYRMLLLIATPKLVDKAAGMFKEGNVPTEYIFHGQGTATSEIMDMLGLDGVDKNILMGMLPKPFADEMLKKLRKSLHLGMPNTGIAFPDTVRGQRVSHPIDGRTGAGGKKECWGEARWGYGRL